MKKHLRNLTVAAVLFASITTAHAFLPAVWAFLSSPAVSSILWLGRIAGANVTRAKALEWSLYGHGAVIGFLAWNSADSPTTTTTPIPARLVVQPTATAQRQNPDTHKWDDPASNERDPKPKNSFALNPGLPNLPSTFPEIVQDMGGAGQKTYWSNNATRLITVTTAEIPGKTSVYNSYVVVNGTSTLYWVYDTVTPVTCPNGYSSSSGTCTLTNPGIVTKEVGKVPCEVMRNTDGTWDVDAKNPECASLSQQLAASGKTVTYTRDVGDSDSVTVNNDGSLSISTRGPGGNRDISTGPYNDAQGGYPITGISDAPGGGTPGGGSGGSGDGGNCGAPGQPVCAVSVDDSGFAGKDSAAAAKADEAIAAISERNKLIDEAKAENNYGVEASWIPRFLPGPMTACEPLTWSPAVSHGPTAGLSGSVQVDWCDKLDVFRQFVGWLVYIATGFAIVLMFLGSNKGGSK